MPDYSRHRRAVLLDLFQLTGGDTGKSVGILDLQCRLKEVLPTASDAEIVVRQLADFGQVRISGPDATPGIRVSLTINGVEKAEKMNEPIDIVEHIQNTMRKHPVGGWIVLLFVLATFLFTLLNQAQGFFKGMVK